MRISASTASAAAMLALADANPLQKRGASFSINQVAVPKTLRRTGAQEVLKAYGKYGKLDDAPSELVAAASVTGSVSANPEQYDQAYLCPVKVGDQTLNLDFDTGSADLWVFSTLLPKNEQGSHSLYTPTTGKQESGQTWNITYGDGSGAAGSVYADTVVVGGVTATSQAVEAATSISDQFVQDADNDGLLGLAFSSINTVQPKQATTFFDTVQSSLAKALFAVTLKKGEAGTYDFGFIDSNKYEGALTYVPVNTQNGFWQFTAGGYSVGSSSSVSGSIGTAIADTGTTLLYLPTAAVTAYYKQVSGAKNDASLGGYVFACSSTLPDFNIGIGGAIYTIPGDYISYAPVSDGSSQCFGGIQANTGIGFTIFGDIFLKTMYVVFDQSTGSPRLGFANQGSGGGGEASSTTTSAPSSTPTSSDTSSTTDSASITSATSFTTSATTTSSSSSSKTSKTRSHTTTSTTAPEPTSTDAPWYCQVFPELCSDDQ